MEGWSTLNKHYKGGCFMTESQVLLRALHSGAGEPNLPHGRLPRRPEGQGHEQDFLRICVLWWVYFPLVNSVEITYCKIPNSAQCSTANVRLTPPLWTPQSLLGSLVYPCSHSLFTCSIHIFLSLKKNPIFSNGVTLHQRPPTWEDFASPPPTAPPREHPTVSRGIFDGCI